MVEIPANSKLVRITGMVHAVLSAEYSRYVIQKAKPETLFYGNTQPVLVQG